MEKLKCVVILYVLGFFDIVCIFGAGYYSWWYIVSLAFDNAKNEWLIVAFTFAAILGVLCFIGDKVEDKLDDITYDAYVKRTGRRP